MKRLIQWTKRNAANLIMKGTVFGVSFAGIAGYVIYYTTPNY